MDAPERIWVKRHPDIGGPITVTFNPENVPSEAEYVRADLLNAGPDGSYGWLCGDCERLRQERDDWKRRYDERVDERNALSREVERLRAQMRTVLECTEHTLCDACAFGLRTETGGEK